MICVTLTPAFSSKLIAHQSRLPTGLATRTHPSHSRSTVTCMPPSDKKSPICLMTCESSTFLVRFRYHHRYKSLFYRAFVQIIMYLGKLHRPLRALFYGANASRLSILYTKIRGPYPFQYVFSTFLVRLSGRRCHIRASNWSRAHQGTIAAASAAVMLHGFA